MFEIVCSLGLWLCFLYFFFFQAEDGIRDYKVTGVQTCALPISSVSTDKPDYSPEEVVTITGSGFLANTNVDMSVTRPNGQVDSWSVDSDGSGAFTTTYQLDGITGNYTVDAGDGTNSATTTFTDAAGNLDECTNGGVGATPEPCKGSNGAPVDGFKNWENGNANGAKAHWREGEFISYRDTLSLDAGADYVFTVEYDTVHGGKHAIDYLGSFDATETTSPTANTFHANNNDPCSDKVSGCTPSTPTASATIPAASLVDCASSTSTGTPTQAAGSIKFFAPSGATLSALTATYASQNVVQGSDQCSTSLNILFTISGTFPMKIVVAWGGHISSEAEWGSGTSASFISGSPYHMAQISLTKNGATVSGVGNQDRALEASAVFFSPSIATDIKNAADGSSVTGGTVPAGTTVYDTATLTGASSNAGGTVFYAFYTNLACSGTPSTNQSVTVSSAVVPNSPNKGPLSTGSYSYQAYYAGDSLNFAALSPCEPLTVAELSPTVVTEIHDASQNVVTSVALGTTVHDKATVSGSFGTPTGTVTFTFFTASTGCTGASAGSGTVTLVSGVAHPSDSQGPLAAGSYSFKAHYNGEDANYGPADSACEPLTVNKASPTLSTVIVPASPVALGTVVHDTASFSGLTSGFPATGTVTYKFYSSGTCTGSLSTLFSGDGMQDVTITGTTIPDSSSTSALPAGSYSFQASWPGDSNYNSATATCEPLTVYKGTATLSTVIVPSTSVALGTSVHDTASFSGLTSGFPATGTVTYKFFTGSCSGSLSTLFSGDGMEDVTIGSGSAIPDSSSTSALPAGSYSFQASWPGDSNYNSATSDCEPLTVNKGSPTMSTTIVPASPVSLGTSVHDTASFSSLTSGFPATGTVTYKFFTGSCTGSLSTLFSGDGMEDVTITGTTIPDSSSTSALPAGSYSFQASWPGDSNYNSATATCEPLPVNKATASLGTT